MPEREVNGIRLSYRDEGDGEPLVLLHGLGASRQSWDYQMSAFSSKYRVVVPDLRGFGDSEKPPGPYSVDGFARDVFALTDQLDLADFHVAGLSMGGAITFQMAVMDSQRLRSATIVNSLPSFRPETWKQRLGITLRRWSLRLLGMRGFAWMMARRLFPEEDQEELRDEMYERFAANDPTAYRAAFEALVGWDVEDRLRAIDCPVLVVAADQDYWPVSVKRDYVRNIPEARLEVIEGSRHATPLDRPEAFNRVVLDFLTSVGKRAQSPA